jgi:hypothetical protein
MEQEARNEMFPYIKRKYLNRNDRKHNSTDLNKVNLLTIGS